jgi:predicted O-methyltransferase YrrM
MLEAQRRQVLNDVAYCEMLRKRAAYDTGTISDDSCVILREVTERLKPRVIVEIGTFIGRSTLSMKATEHIYTCDMSNDCFPSSEFITAHPNVPSTLFLNRLWTEKKLLVDFFFFDGRIQLNDLSLILSMSHPETVYAFDDYAITERYEKGVINVRLMHALLPHHILFEPEPDVDSTIAFLIPKEMKWNSTTS